MDFVLFGGVAFCCFFLLSFVRLWCGLCCVVLCGLCCVGWFFVLFGCVWSCGWVDFVLFGGVAFGLVLFNLVLFLLVMCGV